VRGSQDLRKGENEARSRLVNEGIVETDAILEASPLEVLCECTREDCTTFIALSRGAYERVRRVSTHFVVAPDHFDPEIEILVEEHSGYAVIRKREGEAAEVARATDPRR
jgi:hypothetical protein